MSTKWLIGLTTLFIILTIASNIIEQAYLGTGETGTIWNVMKSFQAINFSNPLTAVGGIIIAVIDLVKGIFAMLTFDYAFFTGVWEVFRWLFMSISLGIVVSLVLAIRGVSSG